MNTLPPDTNDTLLTDAEISAAVQRRENHAAAALTPLPGPLRETFAGTPPAVCGITFRDPVFGDLAILKRIQSPLADRFLTGLPGADEPRFGLEQIADLLFLFSTDPEAAEQLAKRGVEEFHAAAANAMRRVKLHSIPALVEALHQLIETGKATAVHYGPATEEAPGGLPGFTTPPASGPTTASAGGGTPSPAS